MKNLKQLLMLITPLFLFACNEDVLDTLSGKFDMDRYEYTKVEQTPTEKMGKGIKLIKMTLSDELNNSLELNIGTTEWILPTGVYGAALAVKSKNQFSATINGDNVIGSGNLEIALIGSIYYINGLLADSSGKELRVYYKGPLAFEIGEDDPEASGYTISLTTNHVSGEDGTVYSNLTKYGITVYNPEGKEVFFIDAINKVGLSLTELVGTYTIAGYPTESWLADNGWAVYFPEWGLEMGGGTYFTDESNVKQYVTKGNIVIAASQDMNGNPLYSFSGENLATLTPKNVAGTGGTFNILYASEVNYRGTVLKDQTINSAVMGMEMKYSVYLPEGWDGKKTYPVLYMLHGANGGNNDWITGGKIDTQLSAAIAAGMSPEMIVIMPNCTVNGKNLFYVNGYQGEAQYMSYFFDEFIPYVENKYQVKSERKYRAIGGLSMGGYGSLYYGGLHPEMFSYVYACSPAVIMEGTPNLFDLYGKSLSEGKILPGITMEIGTSDFLYETAGWFKGYLDSMNISNEFISRDGTHDWVFWAACVPKILAKVGASFKN